MTAMIEAYMVRLYPFCQSLTGIANMEILRILPERLGLGAGEIPRGNRSSADRERASTIPWLNLSAAHQASTDLS
jgi:hypothetical protein